MARESDDSVGPPGFAAPLSFVPAVAVAAAAPDTPSLSAPARRLPDLPWRPIAAAVLLVVLAIGAYGLVNPAAPSDAAVVRHVVSTYEHALMDGDGVKACAQLTPMAQSQLVAVGRKLGIAGTCVAAAGIAGTQLRALFAQVGPDQQEKAKAALSPDSAAVLIAADGRHAFTSPYGQAIAFVHAGNRWLIGAIGRPRKPPPAHVTGADLQFARRADAICRAPTAKMNIALATMTRAAHTSSARRPALLAMVLHRADALGTPMLTRLGRIQPPAGHAATYSEYLATNQQQLVTMRSAAQLADAGQAEAALDTLKATSATGSLVDVDAAALGFKSCD